MTWFVGYAERPAGRDMHAVLEHEDRSRCGRPVGVKDLGKLFDQQRFGRCRVCVGGLMTDARRQA